MSSYPIGAAVLAVPVFAVPVWMGWLQTWRAYRLTGKIAASLMVALSAGFLFLAGAAVSDRRSALVAAVAYGLATNAWTVASQALWQHGPGMLCLSLALLAAVRLERGAGAPAALAMGAALGLAFTCRSLNAIPGAALGLFVALRHRKQLLPFALPLAAAVTWQLGYNLSTFGEIRGGYDAIYQSDAHGWRGLDLDNVFSHPLGRGLAGILVSPSKGLLVFTPYMAFALAALVPVAAARLFPLGRYLALWIALILIALSRNRMWWGGASYGPRYLCEALTALTLVLAWSWPRIAARRWLRAAFAASLAVSVATQLVGAFFTPCGWHAKPVSVDREEWRLWDWGDPHVLRCLAVGLRLGPAPFEFLER